MAKFKVNVDSGITLKDGSHAEVYSEIDVDPKDHVEEIKSGRLIPVIRAAMPKDGLDDPHPFLRK